MTKILLFSEGFENCRIEIITFFSHKKVVWATKRLFESQKGYLSHKKVIWATKGLFEPLEGYLNHNTNSTNLLFFNFEGTLHPHFCLQIQRVNIVFFYYFLNSKKNKVLLIRGKPNIKEIININLQVQSKNEKTYNIFVFKGAVAFIIINIMTIKKVLPEVKDLSR